MAGPTHRFLPNLGQQNCNQFAGAMQNQMNNSMQNQMQGQMAGQLSQMGMQMNSGMGNQLNNQMNHAMGGQLNNALANQMNNMSSASNQIMGQMNAQYNMGSTQIPQGNNQMQMVQQQSMGIQHLNQMQQQSPQVSQAVQQPTVAPTPTPTPPAQQQPQPAKEFNTASLCRIGQETVQDIVSRTQEVFQTLKQIQPPNGTPQGASQSNDKKVKVQEQLRTIRVLFKRLRLIYEKCNENCQIQGMEYTHIESLIPHKDEIDPKHDEKKNTEAYRSSCEEMKEIMEQVVAKNKQLKDVVDILRRIIWEINTMLTMRRS